MLGLTVRLCDMRSCRLPVDLTQSSRFESISNDATLMLFFWPNSFSFFDFQVSYGWRRVLSHDSCNSPCVSCNPEAHVIFSHRAFCAFSRIVCCWVIKLWQLADDKWTKQTNQKKGLRNWVEANKWCKGHKSSVSEKTILPCAGSFMRSREN